MIDLVHLANLAATALASGAVGYYFGFSRGEELALVGVVTTTDSPAPASPAMGEAEYLVQLAANERAAAAALGALADNWAAAGLDCHPGQEIIACHRRAIALEAQAARLATTRKDS